VGSRVSSKNESEFLAESQGMTVEVDIWSHSEENSDLGPTVQRLPPRLLAWCHVDPSRAGLGVNKRFIRYLANNFHFLQNVSRLVHSESQVVAR